MKQKLQKFLYGVLTAVVLVTSAPVCAFAEETTSASKDWPKPPEVTSGAAIVMEASTGSVLYSKSAYDAFYPASTTKLMTSLLAIEQCPLSDIVTCSYDAVYSIGSDSSHIGLVVGESLTMENALYAILLASANEVSYAVAEHIGTTMEQFVDMMNERAAELGCVNTHFVNPHGLDDPDHYSCPYDLALIAKKAIEYTTFRRISGSYYHQIPETNKNVARDIGNTHQIIRKRISCEGVFAGKTGTTSKAGSCLVTCAERDGMTLICVIMKAPNSTTVYDETIALLDYAFENFSLTPITASSGTETKNAFPMLFEDEEALIADVSSPLSVSDTSLVLPRGASYSDLTKEFTMTPSASFSSGENVIGEVAYYYADNYVGSAEILYHSAGEVAIQPSPTPITQSPTPEESASNTPAADNPTNPDSQNSGTESEDNVPSPTNSPDTEQNKSNTEENSTDSDTVNVSGTNLSGTQTPSDSEQTKSDSNFLPIIIGILVGAVVLVGGLYVVVVEIPYQKKRKAYYQKHSRR